MPRAWVRPPGRARRQASPWRRTRPRAAPRRPQRAIPRSPRRPGFPGLPHRRPLPRDKTVRGRGHARRAGDGPTCSGGSSPSTPWRVRTAGAGCASSRQSMIPASCGASCGISACSATPGPVPGPRPGRRRDRRRFEITQHPTPIASRRGPTHGAASSPRLTGPVRDPIALRCPCQAPRPRQALAPDARGRLTLPSFGGRRTEDVNTK